ncbi:MAG: 30S ribosomal protein S12 methylthiotransferase RimO [Candidatus Omnitrophica bacterium CG07_land_8_20_14_0_80_42_15]|uniref:Ribosomal protein uS12 methylthiotransferase RimO n=1 Tax=Candidatus Aquitaenariimonas noxiae TaxID=1974741 RepID=A0A2J0L4C0_9BACT|nr:MAG: 30S ribosomal protein S12 methylthiotransferase RimO [Candidatus Omnitrophica bacterium CG07_land_8_20_14_0_80_42_15]
MAKNRSVNIISLGCPRNLVDSEVMLGLLKKARFHITDDIEGTDTVIVNTCSFINDAKKESIDVILGLIDLKKKGSISHIVVSGCLTQRYKDVLKGELAEVDAFIGVGDIADIVKVAKSVSNGKRIVKIREKPEFLYSHKNPRLFITPLYYAYIKIQEGCVNKCSYCVIPELRGDYRSRAVRSIIKEADMLLNKNRVSEINLIGQDTTLYGMDLYKKMMLPKVLKQISKLLKREAWIRLLYTHPAHFTDELVDVIKDYPICKYVDLPVQHINDKILKAMNRKVVKKEILSLIEKLRNDIPNVVIRTSIIVGFPGEGEDEFKELLDFIEKTRFDRLGAFIYSREEGTDAYNFKDHLPEKVKNERFDQVMKIQQAISEENNKKLLKKIVRVLVDKKVEKEDNLFLGRTQGDAPEVDGGVYLKTKNAKAGDFVDARIIDALEYDLVGEEVL